MKKFLIDILLMLSLLFAALTGCNVHEWPEEEVVVPLYLSLEFNIAMGEYDHYFTRAVSRTEKSDRVVNRTLGEYDMRYTINAYPIEENGTVSQKPVKQYVFTRPVMTVYDYTTEMIDLPVGRFQLMVWADFVEPNKITDMHYHPANFAGIYLNKTYVGNTDYRDAFRGITQVEMQDYPYVLEPQTIIIGMERPLAKYTFVTTDLKEFIEKEATRNNRNSGEEASTKEVNTKDPDTKEPDKEDENDIKFEDYKVVFYYTGFMPNTYNMFTDRPIDSATGVNFTSSLTQLNENEAIMGFDYVMVNSGDGSVLVTVGLFDKENNPLSMSDEINVPLNRSFNTIVRGSFLMQEANGGVGINPGFEGENNTEI